MNYKTLSLLLFVLLAVPFSTHAFSLDTFVKQYVAYLNQKIESLTKENKALKEQLNSCTTTPPITTNSKETIPDAVKPSPRVTVTADPSTVEFGGTTTIRWVAEGATSCTLNSSPVLMAPTGSQRIDVLYERTSYAVTCFDKDKAKTESVTVEVLPWVPPAGYQLLPEGECTRYTAPCVSGSPFLLKMCEAGGCSISG